jgi:mannose-6-phosphate isomerase-like protein (cupin superfamily)
LASERVQEARPVHPTIQIFMPTETLPLPSPLDSQVFDWSQLAAIPTAVGECRNFFDSATRTLARLECHATTLRAGERAHEPHRHIDEELIFIKDGQLEITLNDQKRTTAAGAVLFFASMDLHGLRNSGSGPATYYVLRIFPRDLPPSVS